VAPIEYEVDPKTGVILSRGFGALGDEDVLRHVARVWNELQTTRDADELLDLREATLDGVSRAALGRAADLARRVAGGPTRARLAIVVATDVTYGVARMYELMSDESVLSVRVFRSLEEARGWLGLD